MERKKDFASIFGDNVYTFSKLVRDSSVKAIISYKAKSQFGLKRLFKLFLCLNNDPSQSFSDFNN